VEYVLVADVLEAQGMRMSKVIVYKLERACLVKGVFTLVGHEETALLIGVVLVIESFIHLHELLHLGLVFTRFIAEGIKSIWVEPGTMKALKCYLSLIRDSSLEAFHKKSFFFTLVQGFVVLHQLIKQVDAKLISRKHDF